MDKFMELLTVKEALHPDLAEYLNTDEDLPFPMLQHPLIYDVPYSPTKNALNNYRYEMIRKDVAEATEKGDWSRVVWMHERPYRFDAMMEVWDEIDRGQKLQLTVEVWIDSENIWQNRDEWIDVWQEVSAKDIPGSQSVTDEESAIRFASLPRKVTIWRGVGMAHADPGVSWTTDKAKAEWFARRFACLSDDRQPTLIKGRVNKTNILAVFDARGESEVVALPDDITIIKTKTIGR